MGTLKTAAWGAIGTSLAAALAVSVVTFSGPRADAQMVSTSAVVEIAHPERYSSIIVLSDVHGMYDSAINLLTSAKVLDAQGNWLLPNSLLIVDGDSIDKGPNSIEVLDLWMRLGQSARSRGSSVLHLLGNHEAEFLADPTSDDKATDLLAELQRLGLSLNDLISSSSPRGAFLRSMPVAAKLGRWLVAHSGYVQQANYNVFVQQATASLNTQNYQSDFFIGKQSVLEMKDWWQIGSPTRARYESWLTKNGFYGVIFGHQPGALGREGTCAISTDGRLIKIDNGMPPAAGSHPGSLLVISNPAELNTGELTQVAMFASGATSLSPLPLETSFISSAED